jgi:hypothetical protein
LLISETGQKRDLPVPGLISASIQKRTFELWPDALFVFNLHFMRTKEGHRSTGTSLHTFDRLYGGFELERKHQRAFHVRLAAWQQRQTDQPTNSGDAGGKFGAFAMRAQVAS